jgi:release factor glutamine methyltransferase
VSVIQPYTGRQLFKRAVLRLKQAGLEDEQARFEARMLLSFCWNKQGIALALSIEEAVPEAIAETFHGLLKRRCAQEPIQYLMGEAYFMGFPFKVRPGVLIPRADTEILVRQGLRLLPGSMPAQVLELGIGSGIVLGMLAYHRPLLKGVGVDLSAQALALAADNLEDLGLTARIELKHGSWFKPVTGRRFHMIVTNPPYVSQDEMRRLPKSVLMEPAMALLGGTDGLNAYREILKDAEEYLCPDGWILMEVGWKQAEAVCQILKKYGFNHIEIFQDTADRDRVVIGQGQTR